MIEDINPPKVKNMAVAIVHEEGEEGIMVWNAYLLNLRNDKIEGIIVSTKGYGIKNGEQVKTSVLRHFLDTMEAKSFQKIELIHENLFGISNEFWVSFYADKVMYDKKYIFLAETINEGNLVSIPLMETKGVLIK